MTDNMDNNKDGAFKIRPYSKKELALTYFPHMNDPHAATCKLMRMINLCLPLVEKLERNGYTKMAKTFTSKEVEMIIEHIGEP